MSAATHDWWADVDAWVDAYPGAQAERGEMHAWLCDAPDMAAVAVPHHTRGPKVYECRDGAWFDQAWGVMVAARDITAQHEPRVTRALRPHAAEAWIGCVACPFVDAPAQVPTVSAPRPPIRRDRALSAVAAMRDPAARAGVPGERVEAGRSSYMRERGQV